MLTIPSNVIIRFPELLCSGSLNGLEILNRVGRTGYTAEYWTTRNTCTDAVAYMRFVYVVKPLVNNK